MSTEMFEVVDKVENGVSFLSCILDALWLLHMELEHDLHLAEESVGGMGYEMRLCNAMVPVLRDLERIKEDLDGVVTTAYGQKRDDNYENAAPKR